MRQTDSAAGSAAPRVGAEGTLPGQAPSTGTNVLDLPWVPVTRDGQTALVSLRDALVHGHTYTGLGHDLAPVEREGLLRFLTSLVAVIVRDAADPEEITEKRALAAADVDGFAGRYRDRFDLADPTRPFLQEWHAPAVPLDEKNARPLQQMHVHVPGGSSSRWCLRDEPRDATDVSVLPLLLVVTWFHGKPSNGGRPGFYADKCIAGAPSGGALDTSFHLLGHTLTETLLANVQDSWVEDDETLPAWLAQDETPDLADLVADSRRLWRSTWTPNRPLVLWDGSAPVSFVIGLTAHPVPLVGGVTTVKEAAKAMHAGDYAHIWYDRAAEGREPDLRPVIAPERLLSTEGAHNWYARHLDDHLVHWRNQARLLGSAGLRLGFHNERGDTYGTRSTSEWVEVDLDRLTLGGSDRDTFFAVLRFASEVRAKFAAPLLRASDMKIDGKMRSALVHTAQRDFYAAVDPVVLGALADATQHHTDVVTTCRAIAAEAKRTFRAHTAALVTPATLFRVEEARARFARDVHFLLRQATSPYATTPDITGTEEIPA